MIPLHCLHSLSAMLLSFPVGDQVAEPKAIPDCGVACVYAMLKLLDRPQSMADIQSRLTELNPEMPPGRWSLADLRRCLESYGLHASSIRVPSGLAPVPSILYLTMPDPEKRARAGLPPGHFGILKKGEEDTAIILDLQRTDEKYEITVPVQGLREAWDGTTLVVSLEKIEYQNSWVDTFLSIGIWLSLTVFAIVLAVYFFSRV